MSVVVCHAEKIPKIVKVTVEPKDAAIYINNALTGYGYAEFTRPKKKNEVIIIRCECSEYKPILTKFYGINGVVCLSHCSKMDFIVLLPHPVL